MRLGNNQLYAVCLTIFEPGDSAQSRMQESGFVTLINALQTLKEVCSGLAY